MGTSDGLFQAVSGDSLVAFDFDGTLTWRDSFMAFLRWRAGPARFALGMARLAPASLAYLVHRERGRLKIAATREFLGGATLDEVGVSARAFAAVTASTLLRPDAVGCWETWRERGARLAIVTASPEVVVAPFARRLGANTLIGTRLATDAGGKITGDFGRDVRLTAAYGDTAGDREMLGIADEAGYRVFTERP
jgi:phosphatidylglycerophosphatase C